MGVIFLIVYFCKTCNFNMEFFSHKPSSSLSRYIKSYWMIENCLPPGVKHTHRIVPCGLFELSFYLAEKPTSATNNKNITDNTVITGQLKEYYDINISGKLSLFSIYFYPHGLAMFLDIPLKELKNQSVPLRYIMKNVVNELEDRLSKTKSFMERVDIIEMFLNKQIKKRDNIYQLNRIYNSIGSINKSRGIINLDKLASEACLSRKQFERTFADIVGTTPKQFIKTIRFQNAINEKAQNSSISLTELAHKCGYFDQSHMINDFVSLSGTTPKDYFKEGSPLSDYFL